MTQELTDLKNSIIEGRYQEALEIVTELEAMSRKDYLIKIESFLVRLLVQLIKNQIEGRLTNSWAASIRDSVIKIGKYNLKDNQKSYYIKPAEWQPYLINNWYQAVAEATVEVGGGIYKPRQLLAMVNQPQIMLTCSRFLELTYLISQDNLADAIDSQLSLLPGGEDWAI